MSAASQSRYSKGAMIFHWVIAIAVIVNWRLVEAAEHLTGEDKGWWMGHHKALGMTILILTIGRLLWRWTHPVPALPGKLAAWERTLVRAVHIIFYVLLVGLPLGGWLATSYFGGFIDIWGLFTVPGLPVGDSRETGKAIIGLHKTGGEVFMYLIGLHILGALKHTFFDKNGGIFKMLPFGQVPNS